jgi:Lar family restriction alleviation protein
MAELKTCPFCGGEAHFAKHEGELLPWIICGWCGVETKPCDTIEEAIEAWNRRVGDGNG